MIYTEAQWKRRKLLVGILILLGIAWYFIGDLVVGRKTVSSTEDVLLKKGTKIILYRQNNFVPGGGEWIRSSGWQLKHIEIGFKNPTKPDEYIKWTARKTGPYGIELEHPLVVGLDETSGTAYLISIVESNSKPNCKTYIVYKYVNNVWSEEDSVKDYIGYKANLYMDAYSIETKGRITIKMKEERIKKGIPEYYEKIVPEKDLCYLNHKK